MFGLSFDTGTLRVNNLSESSSHSLSTAMTTIIETLGEEFPYNIGKRTDRLMEYKILYRTLGDNRSNRFYGYDRAIHSLLRDLHVAVLLIRVNFKVFLL